MQSPVFLYDPWTFLKLMGKSEGKNTIPEELI